MQSDSIRVYSQPVPDILLNDIDFFCEGSNYLINPTIESGTSPFVYDWGIFGSNDQIEVSESGIYTLSVTDQNGCSDSHTLELIEQSLPNISFSPEDILICGGIPVEVTAFGADNYIWSPNFSISSDTGSTIEISSLSSITYTLEGFDSIGCSNTVLVPTTATDDFDLEINIILLVVKVILMVQLPYYLKILLYHL